MKNVDEEQLKDFLESTVLNFAKDRYAARNIRRFSEKMPEILIEVGISMILNRPDASGVRYLATQLVRQPRFFQLLTDPWKLSTDKAIELGRRLQIVDGALDVKLAHRLPSRNAHSNRDALSGTMAERALFILDEISTGRRVVPIINHLTAHPDSRISSKATLVVGKRLLNLSWARRLLEEAPDPRVRANAIEAFWGLDTKSAVQLFRQSLSDSENRVVGNSMMGLHLAGDTDLRRIIDRFAAAPRPEFRMTTAWMMGKIGDPAYAEPLSRMIKDVDPTVRGAALRSLKQLRQFELARQLAAPPEPVLVLPPVPEPPAPVERFLDGARFASGSMVMRR
jgi:hypothetical protein